MTQEDAGRIISVTFDSISAEQNNPRIWGIYMQVKWVGKNFPEFYSSEISNRIGTNIFQDI